MSDQAQQTQEQYFRTGRAAGKWLAEQGYVTRNGTVVDAESARKYVGQLRKNPRHGYPLKAVKALGDRTWGRPESAEDQIPVEEGLRYKIRKDKADAELAEIKAKTLSGKYLDRVEEESRDAGILSGIRQSVLNFGPFLLQDLSILVGKHLGDEVSAKLGTLTPDLLAKYNDMVEGVFQGLVVNGGVEL